MDLLRRVVSDGFDVHAAFRGDHECDPTDRAVDQQRAVEFAGDVGAVLDVEAVDLLAGLARLGGHQRVAEHFLDVGNDLVDRLGEADAPLRIGAEFLELALAAAAGMDLALHHVERTGKRTGGSLGFLDLHDGHAFRDRRAIALEQSLGLVFMDVHQLVLEWLAGAIT